MVLRLENISKDYGEASVLDGIDLMINEKECYCLVGRNGAGKSTLIHIIINLITADEGTVELFGKTYDDNPVEIKKNLGVLPEFNPVVAEFSGSEYLRYVGTIYSMTSTLIDKRMRILADYFFQDMQELEKPIAEFSKGMKIKIGICAAVIHKPKFLILDEPFENLDPLASVNLATFINDYRDQGNALLVSSHEINYVEKIATHLGVLENKKLLYSGPLDQFTKSGDRNFDEQISLMLGYKPKSLKDF